MNLNEQNYEFSQGNFVGPIWCKGSVFGCYCPRCEKEIGIFTSNGTHPIEEVWYSIEVFIERAKEREFGTLENVVHFQHQLRFALAAYTAAFQNAFINKPQLADLRVKGGEIDYRSYCEANAGSIAQLIEQLQGITRSVNKLERLFD